MGLINTDVLIQALHDHFSDENIITVELGAYWHHREVEDVINAQPEVIIRCKDCKYCDRGIDEDGNPFLKCLGWVYGGTQEEDFCSHAERKINE